LERKARKVIEMENDTATAFRKFNVLKKLELLDETRKPKVMKPEQMVRNNLKW